MTEHDGFPWSVTRRRRDDHPGRAGEAEPRVHGGARPALGRLRGAGRGRRRAVRRPHRRRRPVHRRRRHRGFLERSPWQVSQLARNVAAPERCSKPVIARLEGYVFGVGLELALACDFRLAAYDIQLGLPEVTLGMIPGSGGTQRLVRLIGLGRAKDIVMRGRRVLADEALALGLVEGDHARGRARRSGRAASSTSSRGTRRSRSRWRSAS